MIEGIEPIGSGTFAALQSYRFEDIVFHAGAHFRPCVEAVETKDGKSIVRVDLDRFHGIDVDEKAAESADSPPGPGRKNQRSGRPQDAFFKGELHETPSNAEGNNDMINNGEEEP